MSGYLQRLAAGAAHLERPLHPFVSALFSSTRKERIVEETKLESRRPMQHTERENTQTPVESKATMELHDDAVSGEPSVKHAVPMLPVESTTAAEFPGQTLNVRPLRDSTASSPAQRMDLMLPQYPHPAATAERQSEIRTREVQQDVARVGKKTPEDRLVRTPLEPLSLPVQPLLVEQWEPAISDEMPMLESMHLAGAQRLNRTPQPTSKGHLATERTGLEGHRESQRGGEDIQIHIGRIEVIAVSQQAAHAPAQARKSQSLDEYLKRRDGRAR